MRITESGEDRWYWAAGNALGSIGGIIAFIWIYIAAVGSVGWVIGIALGWIPAILGALLCYVLLRLLWLPAMLLIAAGLLKAFG